MTVFFIIHSSALNQVRAETVRRPHLTAQCGETPFFMFRPLAAAMDASPAPLQVMKNEEISVRWLWEDGRIWVVFSDGRRKAAWATHPQFAGLVDVLNTSPALSMFLLSTLS